VIASRPHLDVDADERGSRACSRTRARRMRLTGRDCGSALRGTVDDSCSKRVPRGVGASRHDQRRPAARPPGPRAVRRRSGAPRRVVVARRDGAERTPAADDLDPRSPPREARDSC